MTKPIPVKKVVIVGGGTAGWLTAALLYKQVDNISITVVDKVLGSPVGVGEGTVLNFKWALDLCGFNIDDWFYEVNATYKSGILAPGWGSSDNTVWHPFKNNPKVAGELSLFDVWSQQQNIPWTSGPAPLYDVSVNHNKVDVTELSNYAYHIDCDKLVLFLQKKLAGKIVFIKSDVEQIVKDKNTIEKLILKNGVELAGDLFIDCTGWKSILRQDTARVSLEGRLFCDTAIANRFSYIDKNIEMKPYVVTEAVAHGWMWTIPTKDRLGSGLVFNRSITDIETAKDFFVDHWKGRVNRDSLVVLDWTPFYNKDQWKGNVVSIGLSAGFIEPLESTGIALIIEGIVHVNNFIKSGYYSSSDVEMYNSKMISVFEDTIDFISMHYSVTSRTEPFWQHVRDNIIISEKEKYYREELANPTSKLSWGTKVDYMFSGANWACWLMQMGHKLSPRPIDNNLAGHLLKQSVKHELDRQIGGRHHAHEIARLTDYYSKV